MELLADADELLDRHKKFVKELYNVENVLPESCKNQPDLERIKKKKCVLQVLQETLVQKVANLLKQVNTFTSNPVFIFRL